MDSADLIGTRLKSKVFSLEILILLIWTSVPRTNVAWTNVVVTVVISLSLCQAEQQRNEAKKKLKFLGGSTLLAPPKKFKHPPKKLGVSIG